MNQILGSMRRVDERRGAVRIEDVFDTDIADLWSAITEPGRLARWIAAVDGDLRIGGNRGCPHRGGRKEHEPRSAR